MQKEIVCVHCPKGCVIKVGTPDIKISGNECKHGIEYAEQELTEPRRVLTTTVRVKGIPRMLPVRSTEPVPRERFMEVIEALDGVKVVPPIKSGDIIISKILELDIDIIATWEIGI